MQPESGSISKVASSASSTVAAADARSGPVTTLLRRFRRHPVDAAASMICQTPPQRATAGFGGSLCPRSEGAQELAAHHNFDLLYASNNLLHLL